MTKKDIVKEISKQLSSKDFKLTQLKAKEIVQFTFNAIIETLLSEKRIELRNFGVFEVKRRKPRKARNPRTGADVEVPAKNVVTFKPGKVMEEKVLALTDVPQLEEEDNVPIEENGATKKKRPRAKSKTTARKKTTRASKS